MPCPSQTIWLPLPRPLADRGPGVVYTNDWVVDLMLDLVGYTSDRDLGAGRIVEPGCGDGAFLRRIIPRLLESAAAHGRPVDTLVAAVRGYELDPDTASSAHDTVVRVLRDGGVPTDTAERLAAAWVLRADFLLDTPQEKADWVVGNPPYVRVEESTPETYTLYRDRWTTMSGRADIYIGFFEAGLSLLTDDGRLCFICADRWMHNQYGAGLRRHIIDEYALRVLLEVHDADVFDVPVAAYPAITLIERASHSSTVLATANEHFDSTAADRFTEWLAREERPPHQDRAFSSSVLDGQFSADGSWPSGPPERLQMIAALEARLPALSDVGIRVGVGMATGADKVYVVDRPVDVEPAFLKKAVGPSDLRGGTVQWSGRYIVSPWDGRDLADLTENPRLGAYYRQHEKSLTARYVGKRNPESWWRTIDKPPADDYRGPKLLVADINDRIEPVLDLSGYWPLHSAYAITSGSWDLEALGGYLLSDVAGAFVEAYSVKMANGHLRVSAQYLKRIRLPEFESVSHEYRNGLSAAFRDRDRDGASAVTRALLGLPAVLST